MLSDKAYLSGADELLRMREVFDAFDTTASGVISSAVIENALLRLGRDGTAVVSQIREHDPHLTSTLDFEQFMRIAAATEALARPPTVPSAPFSSGTGAYSPAGHSASSAAASVTGAGAAYPYASASSPFHVPTDGRSSVFSAASGGASAYTVADVPLAASGSGASSVGRGTPGRRTGAASPTAYASASGGYTGDGGASVVSSATSPSLSRMGGAASASAGGGSASAARSASASRRGAGSVASGGGDLGASGGLGVPSMGALDDLSHATPRLDLAPGVHGAGSDTASALTVSGMPTASGGTVIASAVNPTGDENPDPKVDEYLRLLDDYRARCEAEGRYEEAEKATHDLEAVRKQEEVRRVRALRARHAAERDQIVAAHSRQYEEFAAEWDAYLAKFDALAAVYLQQLQERHDARFEEHQRVLHEEIMRRPVKFSRDLLEWRNRQNILAKQRKYADAQRVKILADELERRERRKLEEERLAVVQGKENKFKERLAQETAALHKRIEARRSEHTNQRDFDTRRLLQRNRNVLAVLEQRQYQEEQRYIAATRISLHPLKQLSPKASAPGGLSSSGRFSASTHEGSGPATSPAHFRPSGSASASGAGSTVGSLAAGMGAMHLDAPGTSGAATPSRSGGPSASAAGARRVSVSTTASGATGGVGGSVGSYAATGGGRPGALATGGHSGGGYPVSSPTLSGSQTPSRLGAGSTTGTGTGTGTGGAQARISQRLGLGGAGSPRPVGASAASPGTGTGSVAGSRGSRY